MYSHHKQNNADRSPHPHFDKKKEYMLAYKVMEKIQIVTHSSFSNNSSLVWTCTDLALKSSLKSKRGHLSVMSNFPEQTSIFEFNLLSPQFCSHSHLSYCISLALQNSAEARGAKKKLVQCSI